jgi:hypothetical protein
MKTLNDILEDLTDQQIIELRKEARLAGDTDMADLCWDALEGSDSARLAVARAVHAAKAMA